MTVQHTTDYLQVAKVIEQIAREPTFPPVLDEIAMKTGLTLSDLDKLFTNWVGLDAKKVLRYTNKRYIKKTLHNAEATSLPDLWNNTSPHGNKMNKVRGDFPISMERMVTETNTRPARKSPINYSYRESHFGQMLIASTRRGLCYAGFGDEKQALFEALKRRFPLADLIEEADLLQANALRAYTSQSHSISEIKLYVSGTDFQLKVWRALLKIPLGQLTTYGAVAAAIQQPAASRAVGTAIGSNPIAFLIPCHRVVGPSGAVGGYRWGTIRKKAMIAWEAAKANTTD